MILGNFKLIRKNKGTSWPLVGARYFLALVFLSAGVFRLLAPAATELEFLRLGLPGALSLPMAIFEIVAGFCLLFSFLLRQVYFFLAAFLAFALGWALFGNFSELLSSAGELFVFDLSPTDWFLHAIFLAIILTLAFYRRKEGRDDK
jgi:uncharacterized membrane protein YphA (DoxX/SURF4 family)